MQNLSAVSIPAPIPDATQAQILAKIGELETLLAPYLRSLTDIERRGLAKMGADSVSFVENGQSAIEHSLDFMPRDFDPNEFKNAFALTQQLEPIALRLESLARGAEDGDMTFGSVAYGDALEIYSQIGSASKKDSGLLPFYNAMKIRFDKQRGKRTPPTP
jgi:hypothetical protein